MDWSHRSSRAGSYAFLVQSAPISKYALSSPVDECALRPCLSGSVRTSSDLTSKHVFGKFNSGLSHFERNVLNSGLYALGGGAAGILTCKGGLCSLGGSVWADAIAFWRRRISFSLSGAFY